MTSRVAHATIAVSSYVPTTYDDRVPGAPALNEIRVTETFSGDITGEGTVRFLQAQRPDGSASFCGIERVVGAIHGRQGSFLLQDQGTLTGDRVEGTWFVIPGSGTGDLAGLTGSGGFSAKLGEHAQVRLTYDLD